MNAKNVFNNPISRRNVFRSLAMAGAAALAASKIGSSIEKAAVHFDNPDGFTPFQEADATETCPAIGHYCGNNQPQCCSNQHLTCGAASEISNGHDRCCYRNNEDPAIVTCRDDNACCSNNCNQSTGVCECGPAGHFCSGDDQCCGSLTCVNGHCAGTCNPEPPASTCQGKCGERTNNCGQKVDCGKCNTCLPNQADRTAGAFCDTNCPCAGKNSHFFCDEEEEECFIVPTTMCGVNNGTWCPPGTICRVKKSAHKGKGRDREFCMPVGGKKKHKKHGRDISGLTAGAIGVAVLVSQKLGGRQFLESIQRRFFA